MKRPLVVLVVWSLLGLVYVCSTDVRASLWASGMLTATPDTWVGRLTPTGSMEPTLGPRDWLIYQQVPFSHVRPGDVISFRCPEDDQPVTHRVVRRLRDGRLATKGDGNAYEDPWTIGPAEFRGILIAIYTD
jgi:signal peptidase I